MNYFDRNGRRIYPGQKVMYKGEIFMIRMLSSTNELYIHWHGKIKTLDSIQTNETVTIIGI